MVGSDVLIVGGTRFIGRHTVHELLDHEYDVTLFTRGNRDNPFAGVEAVDHVRGDRTEEGELRLAAERVGPDVLIDCVAYYPGDVRAATDICAEADVDAYVYVSSGAAYAAEEIPKREGETRLCDCTTEQATDDTWDSYGPRKAEGDRAVFEAVERGLRAMAVRPPIVYGPFDYTERFDYWVDRVRRYDRVLVPGDGTNLRHLAYVEDVARALRVVAESGEAGEAYNVGDRRLPVLEEWIEFVADAARTEVELIHAGERELAAAGLSPGDFPLYRPYPHVLDTTKLAELGWTWTPHDEAVGPTVEYATGRTFDGERGPARDAEERVLGVLDTL